MAALRLVVVGAGRMGMTHIRALRSSDAVRVVGVCDPDDEARGRVLSSGVAGYRSLESALEAGGFDAAVVASPTSTHLGAVRMLAGANIPILCEKPCGATAAEAAEAGRLASSAGVGLQVGYWRRFVPSLRALHHQIATGSFGAIQWISCFHWDERPPPATFRRLSGGILIDMGVHEFDMTRWLTGETILDAVGRAATIGIDPPVEGDPESLSFVATLEGGGVLSATLGRRFPPGDACRVQVIGTERAADVAYLQPGGADGNFEEALRLQAAAFAGLVGGGEQQGATAAHAEAALLSAEMLARSLA